MDGNMTAKRHKLSNLTNVQVFSNWPNGPSLSNRINYPRGRASYAKLVVWKWV